MNPEKFDFSKKKDQKEFNNLDQSEKAVILEQGQHEANVVNEIVDNENKKPEVVLLSLESLNEAKALVEKCLSADDRERVEPKQEVVVAILKKFEASVDEWRDPEFKVVSLEEINGDVYGLMRYNHLYGVMGHVWNTSDLFAVVYDSAGNFSCKEVSSRDDAKVFRDGDKIMTGLLEFDYDADKNTEKPRKASFYEMTPEGISEIATTYDRSVEYQVNNVDKYVEELENLKLAVENAKTDEEYVEALVKVTVLESNYDDTFSKANRSREIYESPLKYISPGYFKDIVRGLPNSDYKLIEIELTSPNVIQDNGKGYGSHNRGTRFVLVNPKERKSYDGADMKGSSVGGSWATSGVYYTFSSVEEKDKEISLIGKRTESGSTGWNANPGSLAYGRSTGESEKPFTLTFRTEM